MRLLSTDRQWLAARRGRYQVLAEHWPLVRARVPRGAPVGSGWLVVPPPASGAVGRLPATGINAENALAASALFALCTDRRPSSRTIFGASHGRTAVIPIPGAKGIIASYRPSPRTPPDYRRITGPTIGGFPHSRRPPVDRIGCTAHLPPDSAAQDQYCRDDSSFWETETGGSLETVVCTNQSRRSRLPS